MVKASYTIECEAEVPVRGTVVGETVADSAKRGTDRRSASVLTVSMSVDVAGEAFDGSEGR